MHWITTRVFGRRRLLLLCKALNFHSSLKGRSFSKKFGSALCTGAIAGTAEPSRQEEREGSEEEHPDLLSTALAGSMGEERGLPVWSTLRPRPVSPEGAGGAEMTAFRHQKSGAVIAAAASLGNHGGAGGTQMMVPGDIHCQACQMDAGPRGTCGAPACRQTPDSSDSDFE
ncbi:myotubularin-related protein 4 isoform X1 [Lates japonicus]|uniref:Myotubularin-related protein 4 isoform X1 n=1 Tax=Lates japonicus TaxID=270547 RepID=A0AAD3M2F2_LATJO|nr:myotubularin-related protein 4 isoform X1 [Lates japonicus]